MDTDYEYPIHGWTATNHYNDTLDLFYHRWQTGREAQEIFLEQSPFFLEAESGQQQQVQVNTGIVTRDDAQVAASWNSLWDEEEDTDDTEREEDNNSFYYCLSPEKVCSMESVTSTAPTVVSFSFIGEDDRREFPSTDRRISEAHDLTMPTPRSSHTSPDPSGASCVANTGDLNKGKDTGRSSLEHCGLPSYDLNHRSSEGDQQKEPQTDKLTHGTRWEPIKVMLGNWEKEYSVIKPYADYTDVPSPIILPGSPPQRPPKPSLAGFYKVPTVRDPLENYLRSSRHMNIKEEPSPPAPPLQFPNRIASTSQDLRRRRPHRSNSDISVLDLGEPYQPLDTNYLAGDSNAAISLSLARGARPSALTTTSIYRAFPSPPPVTLQPSRGLRARRGLGSTALSVQVPANSNPSRSASGSPQSKGASATSSLGATFQLDEELNNRGFLPRSAQR